MLKFEGKFAVGNRVRAYDFKPSSDRPEQFVEGVITAIDNGFGGYVVKVETDSVFTKNPRPEVIVPFEVFFMEFDNRISLA